MIPTCDLSVLVTTWNSERWIARCLESLMAQKGVCFEVLAVDNGSTDGTCRLVRRLAPHARLIRHSSNIGPARARNIAIAQAKGRYVLTLDHDMELESGFLKTLVSRADRSLPGVGMWSGKFLCPDRRTLDSTGIVLTKRWRAFDRGGGEIDRGQWDTQREILGPSACAALYRRRMLEDVYQEFEDPDGNFLEQFQTNGFDARFFELYLFAYCARSGFAIDRTRSAPDFLVTRDEITVAVEATTVNRSKSGPLVEMKAVSELSEEELRAYQDNELPIRFGSALLRRSRSAASTRSSIRRAGTSSRMRSPFCTSASGPPAAASGLT